MGVKGARGSSPLARSLGYEPPLLQEEHKARRRLVLDAAAQEVGDEEADVTAVKVIPPSRERVERAKRAARHRRLQQARAADRVLAAHIREHYRERLAAGKRRKVVAAFAAWRTQMETRVTSLSARLRRSALAIGAAHRSADAERARIAEEAAEAEAQAARRGQAATVRFSQAWRTRGERRGGGVGDVMGEMGLMTEEEAGAAAQQQAAAKHREEMRRQFMAKSRLAARRKAQAAAAGLGPASPVQVAGAAGTGPSPVKPRGATPAKARGRGGPVDALPELEALLALDKARREWHQALIAAAQREVAAATAPSGAAAAPPRAGPRGVGASAVSSARAAEQAVEAIFRGAGLGLGRPMGVAAGMRAPPRQERPTEEGLRWNAEEGERGGLAPVVEGVGEGVEDEDEEEEEEDGAVRRLYAEMEDMMRRIDALQREMDEGVTGGAQSAEEAEEMMTTAELEREIEACRRSLELASRNLQRPMQAARAPRGAGAGAAMDPHLASLLAQRRRMEEEAAELRTQALSSRTPPSSGGARSSAGAAGAAGSGASSSSSSSASGGGYRNRLLRAGPPRRLGRGLGGALGEVDLGASSSAGLSSGSETVALRRRAAMGASSSLGSRSVYADEHVAIEVADGQMLEQSLLGEEESLEALGYLGHSGVAEGGASYLEEQPLEEEEEALPAEYLQQAAQAGAGMASSTTTRPSLVQAFHQRRAEVLRRMEAGAGATTGEVVAGEEEEEDDDVDVGTWAAEAYRAERARSLGLLQQQRRGPPGAGRRGGSRL